MQAQMASALYEDMDAALHNHEAWKLRLRQAVARRETDFAVSSIKCDRSCAFGDWFQSLPRILRLSREAREVERSHARFHACAAAIVDKIANGDFDTAISELSGRVYNDKSAALINAMTRWKLAAF